MKEMSKLTDLVTMTYQQKGYILARAYLPEQDISDGVLTIAITEGRIGTIRIAGKTNYHDRVVKRFFKTMEKHGVVREGDLERAVLLTNEMRDLETEVVLERGQDPGTVDVVVNTKDTSKATLKALTAHVSLDYNNYGSEMVSKDRFGISLDLIDHTWGSEWSLRKVFGIDPEDTELWLCNLAVPVNHYGTKIGARYIYGDYQVGQDLAALDLDGRTTVYGVSATHPLIKKKDSELGITLGYDHIYTKNYFDDSVSSIDEIDEFYGIAYYNSIDRFQGKNILSLGVHGGTLDSDKGYLTSRQDSASGFVRTKLSLARIQRIFEKTHLMLRGTGQYTDDRLLPAEMITIGGYGTVRGHTAYVFMGDYGYYGSAELLFAPPFISEKTFFNQSVAQLVQLAVFYDTGGVYINDPSAGERRSRHISGYGAGLRLFYKDMVSLHYDIGFPVDRLEDEDSSYHYVYFKWNLF